MKDSTSPDYYPKNTNTRNNNKYDKALLNRDIVNLRRKNKTFAEISEILGIPHGTVYNSYRKLCKDIPSPDLEQHRKEMLEQLDLAEQSCMKVIRSAGYKIAPNGAIVHYKGKPVLDKDMMLNAVRTLMQVQQRKARLLGLDAEAKQKTPKQVNFTLNGVDIEDLK